MKFSLISAFVVVLVLTHGSESLSLVKRDAPLEVDTLIKYMQDLSSLLTKTTQGLIEGARNHELTGKASAYIEDGKTQLQPLVKQIQEQLKPLTESVQTQVKPFSDSLLPPLEQIWKTLLNATNTMTN